MSSVSEAVDFLTTAENWSGNSGLGQRLVEHLQYSASATAVAVFVALPIGLYLGHLRRFGNTAINLGNLGRAVPTFGVMALAQQFFGLDQWPLLGPAVGLIALVALGIPPILINGYTGMAEVPDEMRDAARGMGFTDMQQMFRVEIPVGLPLIITGIRIAMVQVVATAAFLAVFGFGGLGRPIVDGIAKQDDGELLAGAFVLASLVAVLEISFGLVLRLVGTSRSTANQHKDVQQVASAV